jgi:ankyrin repeat protein
LLCNHTKLSNGASAGWTALHVASADGRAEMMELLIEMGANVEATDTEGHTPLHFAVSCNRKMCVDRHSVVSLLIERGAGVNKADSTERTPLHTAASRGHTQACRTLLKNMIDVGKPHSQLLDAVEKEGRSALHLAAAGGHLGQLQSRKTSSSLGSSPCP